MARQPEDRFVDDCCRILQNAVEKCQPPLTFANVMYIMRTCLEEQRKDEGDEIQ